MTKMKTSAKLWPTSPARLFPVVAVIVYMALCAYINYPWLSNADLSRYILMLNSIIAATGCYVLSRRWVTSYIGSLIAGSLYGFSPFALALSWYHPLAAVPLAALPWLFCPAAFWRKTHTLTKWLHPNEHSFLGAVTTTILCFIPFAAIYLFFQFCAYEKIFPIPLQQKLTFSSLYGLVLPLTIRSHQPVFSFYHIPVVALVMGGCMYVALNRPGIAVIAGVSLVLSFLNHLGQVSPVTWTLIPLLFGSILAGLGAEGLAWAGPSDRKWILLCAAVPAVFSAACLYLWPGATSAYRDTAALYAAAAALAATIYFLTRANLRLHPLRWLIICAGIGVDIAFSAAKILGSIR